MQLQCIFAVTISDNNMMKMFVKVCDWKYELCDFACSKRRVFEVSICVSSHSFITLSGFLLRVSKWKTCSGAGTERSQNIMPLDSCMLLEPQLSVTELLGDKQRLMLIITISTTTFLPKM